MKHIAFVAASAGALLLSACATGDRYRSQLDAWEGRAAADLATAWGEPDERSILESGAETWTYRATVIKSKPERRSSGSSYIAQTTGDTLGSEGAGPVAFAMLSTSRVIPATTFRSECETRFVLSEDHIRHASFEGKGCELIARHSNVNPPFEGQLERALASDS